MENVTKTRSAEAVLRDVFEYLPAFIVVVRRDNQEVMYFNHIAGLLFNADRSGNGLQEFLGNAAVYDEVMRHLSDTNEVNYDKEIKSKWFHISDSNISWVNGEDARIIFGVDITEVKRNLSHLTLKASTDVMTGITNRQAGLEYLDFYIADVKNSGTNFTACYIDINNLKHINDTYGHSAGDEYIKTVVSCVRSSIRRTDVFARLGGDEFLLIFPNCRYEIVDNIMGIVTNKLNFINEAEDKEYSISYGIMEITTETVLDREYIMNTIDSKMYYMKEELRRKS